MLGVDFEVHEPPRWSSIYKRSPAGSSRATVA